MSRYLAAVALILTILVSASLAFGATRAVSDPQALAYAAQAVSAVTGGISISDVTLTGTATWGGTDSGTATLTALGSGESRMDLLLSSGTRTEIRDLQTGIPLGQWVNPDKTLGHFASHNCRTDAVWFFPILGSLTPAQNTVLTYIGPETRNGANVLHLQSYVYQPTPTPSSTTQQLSTMDFYLDANTLLPTAITYNGHPDNSMMTNLPIEVDFANYQNIGGVNIPTHVQRYQQGNLMVDMTVSGAAFNTGLQLSTFAVN